MFSLLSKEGRLGNIPCRPLLYAQTKRASFRPMPEEALFVCAIFYRSLQRTLAMNCIILHSIASFCIGMMQLKDKGRGIPRPFPSVRFDKFHCQGSLAGRQYKVVRYVDGNDGSVCGRPEQEFLAFSAHQTEVLRNGPLL